ncbi:MAG TPA: hypothetical protein GX696_09175 [Pseudomonadaceae bacterium]|nr:hypothetical protein [Pseudomonadaceae bacterium]
MNTGIELQEISRVYVAQQKTWREYLAEVASAVSILLESRQLHPSVKWRVKSFESLSEKRSFLLAREHKRNGTDIKDLLGLRIVVPFQEDVEQSVKLLREHYNIGEIERKSEQLSFREFAYDSVHIVLPLTRELVLPLGCRPGLEVQVRTVLQDAWAEVEHELIYKNHFRYPNTDAIRKKLAAVNASLSLADMIFQEIRDKQKEMAEWGRARFKSMLDKAEDGLGSIPQTPLLELPQTSLTDTDSASSGTRADMERHLMAALKAHNDKDFVAAVGHYTRVLECNPELSLRSIVFSHRGMAYFMLQQESLALSDFDRSYQCDKLNYRALNYRAMILRRMGYVQEALDCFALSLEIMPKQAEVHLLRAQTLVEVERVDEAAEELRQVLTLEPGNDEARQLLEHLEPGGGLA